MTATNETVTINTSKDTSLLASKLALVEVSISTLNIASDEDYQAAGDALNHVASFEKQVEDFFGPDRDMAHRLHKSICEKINRFKKPLDLLRQQIGAKMGNWKRQQLMAAQAEQHKRDEADRKEREAAAAAAARLIKQGFVKEAKEITQAVEESAAIVHQEPATPKLKDVRESMPWVGAVTDPMALIKAIAAGQVPLMHSVAVKGVVQEVCLVEFNSTVINQMAKKLQGEFKWPGCESNREIRFSGRRS